MQDVLFDLKVSTYVFASPKLIGVPYDPLKYMWCSILTAIVAAVSETAYNVIILLRVP